METQSPVRACPDWLRLYRKQARAPNIQSHILFGILHSLPWKGVRSKARIMSVLPLSQAEDEEDQRTGSLKTGLVPELVTSKVPKWLGRSPGYDSASQADSIYLSKTSNQRAGPESSLNPNTFPSWPQNTTDQVKSQCTCVEGGQWFAPWWQSTHEQPLSTRHPTQAKPRPVALRPKLVFTLDTVKLILEPDSPVSTMNFYSSKETAQIRKSKSSPISNCSSRSLSTEIWKNVH